MPASSSAVACTKTSFPPSSGVMKPKPLHAVKFNFARNSRFFLSMRLSALLLGTYLEIGEDRFDGKDIRRLYESESYPLKRRLTARSE
jgi:hypothetical protein